MIKKVIIKKIIKKFLVVQSLLFSSGESHSRGNKIRRWIFSKTSGVSSGDGAPFNITNYPHTYVLCTNQWSMRLLRGGFTSHKLHELHNCTTQQNMYSTTMKWTGGVALLQHTLNHSQVSVVPACIIVHTTQLDVGSSLVRKPLKFKNLDYVLLGATQWMQFEWNGLCDSYLFNQNIWNFVAPSISRMATNLT